MFSSIDASSETLWRQGPITAHGYLKHAIHDIDELLGEGYAKAHPELMAAFMQTAAMDYGAAVIARAIEGVAAALNPDGTVAFDPDWVETNPPESLQSLAAKARGVK